MRGDGAGRAGWKEVPLPEAIDFQEGPGILAKDFRPAGVPLIRLAGLGRGARLLDGCNYLDEQMVAEKWPHFRVQEGDVLLSTSASLGRVATVDAASAGAIPYTGIIRMRPRAGDLRPSFIPYLLASPHFQQQVEAMGVGSVIRHFGPTHLRRMSVVLPSVRTQDAIAHILGTLDDKIELNRRMNETLEAMARAFFKSWFVDFDPVRARATGRPFPGMEPAIAALFPRAFEDSALGPIPEGWRVLPLDRIAHFQNGLALQRFRPREGEAALPVIKIAQLRSGRPDSGEWARASIKPACIIEDGDVVFSWSGSLMVVVWGGGRGALNQHLFKVTSDTYPKWFYLHATRLHLPEFRAIAAGKATTMGHIKRRHLSDALCVVPPLPVLREASAVFGPLLERLQVNAAESLALERTRDALLPRLLSGELPAADAERAAAAGA